MKQPPIETLNAVAALLAEHNAVDVLAALADAAEMCQQGTLDSATATGSASLAFSHASHLLKLAALSVARAEAEATPHGPFGLAAGADIVADLRADPPPSALTVPIVAVACPACGATMRASFAVCPRCGWDELGVSP